MKTFDVAYDWFVDTEVRYKMQKWMDENIKHTYGNHKKYCDVYCFKNEADAVAFKLMWGI